MNRQLLLVLLILSVSACGPEKGALVAPSTSCQAGTALIAVHDGLVENLCGCAEPRATGTFTTCTVAAGTSVVFQFSPARLRHQIVSTSGGLSFPSSPVNNPDDEYRAFAHAVTLATPGIYRFADTFHPTVSGQIIVF